MRFRPCIDIHNGCVKQIVGDSLSDERDQAEDNYVSEYDGAFYGRLYRQDSLKGGHIILLNPVGSEWYEKDVEQARQALLAYPKGLQIGGGIREENAESFLEMGASHVIVTSYVFREGRIDHRRLERLSALVGKDRLVLDLSCRWYEDGYHIMTDRWQKRTKECLSADLMEELAEYCDEFLIHAVDVEGRQSGIEKDLIRLLGEHVPCPVTYAGGIHSMEDLDFIQEAGKGKIDFTIGSALDLFGGKMPYREMIKYGACE